MLDHQASDDRTKYIKEIQNLQIRLNFVYEEVHGLKSMVQTLLKENMEIKKTLDEHYEIIHALRIMPNVLRLIDESKDPF